MKSTFLLSENIHYLNHGSFGACPKTVFNKYQEWQLKLEQEPFQFMTKTGVVALKKSKEALADFLHCQPEDFFFTPNPTTALNTVIKSLELNPGDEILTTSLEYGAMDKTWDFYCLKSGAKYVQQTITLPIKNKEHFLDMFWQGLSENTKIIFISEITSSTALILPVKEIVAKAKVLGLITIIDGAHTPGHIELDIAAMNPDFYAGAVHKWLLAPKGSSFLYASKRFQDKVEPLSVSWGYDSATPGDSQFLDYHEFNGTRDFSAYLVVPELLQFRKDHDWLNKTDHCKDLILEWYPKLCEVVGSQPICPLTKDFLGQMCSVPILTDDPIELKEELYQRYHIEIPVTNHEDRYWVRLSIQPYTTTEDIEALYKALKELKQEGKLLN